MITSPLAGPSLGRSIAEYREDYRTGATSPSDVIEAVLARITDRGEDGTWITVVGRDELMIRAKELEQHDDPASLPLFGIPFGVKDSIDVDGVPTTLACPDYAYRASA